MWRRLDIDESQNRDGGIREHTTAEASGTLIRGVSL